MPAIPRFNAAAILRVLSEHGVDFLVVGGIAAALEGVPLQTYDLDVVHSRREENITRLLAALEGLGAIYRSRPGFKPEASHLASPGHQLLLTRWGPLDVLGSIGRHRGYDDLRPHAKELEIGDGLRVLALDLATLIAVKEEVGADRDLAALPLMRRTLEEKKRRKTPS